MSEFAHPISTKLQNTEPSASTSRAKDFPPSPLASATAKKITFGRPLIIYLKKALLMSEKAQK